MSVAVDWGQAEDFPHLAAAFRGSGDLVELIDSQGTILFSNTRETASPDEDPGNPNWLACWGTDGAPLAERALALSGEGTSARFRARRSVCGHDSKWWDVCVSLMGAADNARRQFLAIARDITDDIVERERLEAVAGEMRHRLKNALTIAGGLVAISARGKPELASFVGDVTQRFADLATVQALILDPNADKNFAEIVPMLGAVYGGRNQLQFGPIPAVSLDDSAVQALALAFGELCTNSLKYGALRDGRTVEIDTEVVDGNLTLTWREPTTFVEQEGSGQGLGLIDRIVTATSGRVDRSCDGNRLTVRIALPTRSSL